MKFRLTATNSYNSGNDAEDLKKYLKMIDEGGLEAPTYIIEDGRVYVIIFYGSDMAKLLKIIGEELIVTNYPEEPTIEIYNGWRE